MKKKTRELIILIHELSYDQDILEQDKVVNDYIHRFVTLYCDGYRHQYSYIYMELNKLRKRDPGSLQILNQNIKIISDEISNNENLILPDMDNKCKIELKENLGKSMLKLYDHISLDIARFDEIECLERELKISERKAQSMKDDIEKIIPELNKSQQELVESKNQYVSILGIFASIVIGFFANLAFGSSVLENIDSINIYRLLLVTVIVGWIMTVSLSILLEFIHQTLVTTESKFQKLEPKKEIEEKFPYFMNFFRNKDESKVEKNNEIYLVNIKSINIFFGTVTILIIIAWFFDIITLRDIISTK